MEAVFPLFILFFIVIVALVVWGAVVAKKKAEDRRQALAAFAAQSGLRWTPDDPLGLVARLAGVAPFNVGHDQEATNVLDGVVSGRRVVLFDYKYVTTETRTDSKGHTTTEEENHYLSALIHPLELPYPDLLIRPEGFGDKVAAFFGHDDIDFESDEFSRKFFVTGPDKKFAYDICHARMMEFLLANPRRHIELTDALFILRTERPWEPEEFAASLGFTMQFFDLIPEFVRKQYRETAGTAE